jgi:CubicO group peptidase (beta-lactamase class C family)
MLNHRTRVLAALLWTAFGWAHAQTTPASPPTAQQDFDTRTFAGLGHTIEALPDIRSVVVLRRGRVAFEFHRSGHAPDSLHSVESVTKSVLSTLVGIALSQGHIASLDQPVVTLMPELAGLNADPRARQLSVRHLLTMTAGFAPSERRFFDPKERAQFAMSRPFESDPGAAFRYDNPAANLLAAVLAKAVGETPAGYAQRQLFAPLGIERSDWAVDEQGRHLGHTGLKLRTHDMAKVGQLLLQEGAWAGQQLLPRDVALAATRRHNAGGPPVGLAYGYLWWVDDAFDAPRKTFVASGFGGQLVWVHPPLDLVVAVNAEVSQASTARNQAIDLIRKQIVPAVLKTQAEQPPRAGG